MRYSLFPSSRELTARGYMSSARTWIKYAEHFRKRGDLGSAAAALGVAGSFRRAAASTIRGMP